MMKIFILSFLFSLVTFAGTLSLDKMKKESRVAFVIVNESYKGLASNKSLLGKTSINTFLKQSGFTTIYLENGTRNEIIRALRKYRDTLAEGGVAMLYYSGYSAQVDGVNYILPVDTIHDRKAAESMKIELDAILNVMKRFSSRVNIIIMDNLENKILNTKLNVEESGLAKINPPKNTDLVLSSKPNSSHRTSNLSAYITKTFSKSAVSNAKGFGSFASSQKMSYVKLSKKEFYFSIPKTLAKNIKKTKKSNEEEHFWVGTLKMGSLKAFEYYILRFPQGQHLSLAKKNIAGLKEKEIALVKIKKELKLKRLALEAAQAQELADKKAATLLAMQAKEKEAIEEARRRAFIEPSMVKIKSGTFKMGCATCGNQNELPAHYVSIKDDFYMGMYEVSNAEYNVFLRANDKPVTKNDDDKPVVGVSWTEANAYTVWLSTQSGKNYQLPSESQWEYVSRADTKTKYFWGNQDTKADEYSWIKKNSDSNIHNVGKKKPNNWGIYDLHGNVFEWCSNDYRTDYSQISKDKHLKVIRGGSYQSDSKQLTASYRAYKSDASTSDDIGFRLVLKPQNFKAETYISTN